MSNFPLLSSKRLSYCGSEIDDTDCYSGAVLFTPALVIILFSFLRHLPVLRFMRHQFALRNERAGRIRAKFSNIWSLLQFLDSLRLILTIAILSSSIALLLIEKKDYGNELDKKADGRYVDFVLFGILPWVLLMLCIIDEILTGSLETKGIRIFSVAQLIGESLNLWRLVKNYTDADSSDPYSEHHQKLLMIWGMVNLSFKFALFFVLTCFNRDWRVLRKSLKTVLAAQGEDVLNQALLQQEDDHGYFSDVSSTYDEAGDEEGGINDGFEFIPNAKKKVRTPEEYAGLLSRLTFSWLNNLMRTGYQKPLEDSDFYRILHRDESNVLAKKFEASWNQVIKERDESDKSSAKVRAESEELNGYTALADDDGGDENENGNGNDEEEEQGDLRAVLKSLHRAGVLNPFYEAAIYKMGYDTLNFVPPQLMHSIISFMGDEDAPFWHGYLFSGLLILSAGVQTFLLHIYFHKCFRTGMRVRSALLTAIYKKSLVLSPSAKQKKTTGEIVNLMSVDCQRLQNLFPYLHVVWSAPYVIILSLSFLWMQLKYSVFVAVGVILFVMVPLTNFVAGRIKVVQKEVMKTKDERIRRTGEAITSMKVIKLYGWESAFRDQICDARDEELRLLRRYALWRAAGRTLWTATPVIVTLSTFASFIIFQDGKLDAATAFTSLTLLNILRFPLAVLPNILNSSMEASVSLKRISLFFESNELRKDTYIENKVGGDENNDKDEDMIAVKNGEFYWDDAKKSKALSSINLNVSRGSICLVTGEVGSGKTALMKMLIGELQPLRSFNSDEDTDGVEGKVFVNGSLAYSAQVPWIQNATVRDNILFGTAFDKKWYQRVVHACALESDFKQLPYGDQTEIGERGINLSGGQKARLSLARAVYSHAEILLLETVFEAVDEHVGEHLWKECFNGILKEENPITGRKRTVVVVTHALKHMAESDKIIVMANGGIVVQGTYEEVSTSKVDEFERLLASLEKNQAHSGAEGEKADKAKGEGGEEEEEDTELAEKQDLTRRGTSIVSEKGKTDGDLTGQEERGVGQVSWSVYAQYISALGGTPAVLLVIISFSAKTAMDFITTRWLAYWSSHVKTKEEDNLSGTDALMISSFFTSSAGATSNILNHYHDSWVETNTTFSSALLEEGKESEHSSTYYLSIYTYLSIGAIAIIITQVIMIALISLRASREMHHQLVQKITRAPMSFFDTTPIGRILNRFSKDIYTLDEPLPGSMFSFLSTTFSVIGTVFSIAYVSPMFLVAVPFLIVGYRGVQLYYIATSRELKRWDSVLRSPIYSFFTETLDGSGTIRAYGVEKGFTNKNQYQLDRNLEAYYLSIAANRWLAVRLEYIGNLLVFFSALFISLKKDDIDPSLSGLALSYALGITQTLNWTVRMVSELETNIVSVERVDEYIAIESEAPEDSPDKSKAPKSGENWPSTGKIEISDVYAKYRDGLPDVLRGLSVVINAGEKVGVVGRTGAGKSSLFLVLMRLVEPSRGKVLIDGYDTKNLGLHQLRSSLAIIPQDPVMFCGTLRANLDPAGAFSDGEMWNALKLCRLEKFVREYEGKEGLDMVISEGGSNFSFGQRQLICIARAVLRNNKILLMDEATSGIDLATDSLIQETIRDTFTDCTVITIAHRIETILSGDKVMVMDAGKIAEFGPPKTLLSDKSSMFSALTARMKKTK